jgi:iron complex outermembrane receptor protein
VRKPSSRRRLYNDPKVVARDADGFVDFITVKKENRGKLNTSGFDVSLNWRGEAAAWGTFGRV